MLYSINATTEDEIRFVAPKCDLFTKINKSTKWGKGLGTGKQQKRKIGCQWPEITNKKHMTVKKTSEKKNKWWKTRRPSCQNYLLKGQMGLWAYDPCYYIYFYIFWYLKMLIFILIQYISFP